MKLKALFSVVLVLIGWGIFSYAGMLPDAISIPWDKLTDRPIMAQRYFDKLEFDNGCYKDLINTGENGNLFASQNSDNTSGMFNNFAYTSRGNTYIAIGEELYLNKGENREYSKIYDSLDKFTVGMARYDDNKMIFVSHFGNIGRVQVYTDKVHTVNSEWYRKVRGKEFDYGLWTESEMYAEDDFKKISRKLTEYLNKQDNEKIDADEFCGLLYYQSIGMLVDYSDGKAIFVNRHTGKDNYELVTVDKEGNMRVVAEIPVTTGHFHHNGYFYYSVGADIIKLDMKTGNSECLFRADDKIEYLNYKTNCTANGNEEETLCVQFVTKNKVYAVSEYHKTCGDVGIENFDDFVKGFYVFKQGHDSILIGRDTDGEVNAMTYHLKEE